MRSKARLCYLLVYKERQSSKLRSVIIIVHQKPNSHTLQSELDIPVNQALALFVKAVRKICTRLQNLHKVALGADIPENPQSVQQKGKNATNWQPLAQTVEEELQEAGDEVTKQLRTAQREMIDALDMSK